MPAHRAQCVDICVQAIDMSLIVPLVQHILCGCEFGKEGAYPTNSVVLDPEFRRCWHLQGMKQISKIYLEIDS